MQAALPALSAAYVFGSQAQGTAGPDSDLDLAVPAGGPVDPVQLCRLSADLAGLAGCPVDVVDLLADILADGTVGRLPPAGVAGSLRG